MTESTSSKQNDLYARLGVGGDADQETIKQAYHSLARKYHPDKQKRKSTTTETNVTGLGDIEFTLIQEAYETLINPVLRKEYDLVVTEGPIWSDRPGKNSGKPLDVSVVIGISKWHIKTIDGHEHLEATFTVTLKWLDDRLKNWGDKAVPEKIWKPEFFSVPLQIDFSEKDKLPTIADRNEDNGLLMYEVPLVDLKYNLDDEFHRLLNFPFDSLRLDGFFCLSNELRLENSNDIRLHLNNKTKDGKPHNIYASTTPNRGEFIMTGISYGLATHSSPNIKNQSYDDLVFSLHLQRNPTFYIYKAQVPTIAIVVVSLLTFIYDAADLSDRMETVMGMFLTSFAIQ